MNEGQDRQVEGETRLAGCETAEDSRFTGTHDGCETAADGLIHRHPGVPLLRVVGVSKRFGATLALDGVELVVERGSIHAVVGENGAGKSTLMKILSGAHGADAGRVELEGRVYEPRGPLAARRAGVAMIYQELALAPHLTVAENILLGMERATLGWVRRGEQRKVAREALLELGHGDIGPDEVVGGLSIARRQIVEIARAVAVGCRLLILDEPTSSLNRVDIERLFALLRRLKEKGLGVIYISHFLEEVMRVADRYTVLRDGRTVGSGAIGEIDAAGLARLMVGRAMTDLYDRHPRVAGEVLLEVRELSGRVKPRGASVTVRRGEVVGIAGLVGAGRTELMRAVFGLDEVKGGSVKVGVWSGASESEADRSGVGGGGTANMWKGGVGYVSEDRKAEGLATGMTIADNMTLTRLRFGPGGLVMPGRQRRAAEGLIGRLGVRCRGAEQAVGTLSGGNQQKVALARLLHHDVDLLLLDEPTRGIDIASKAAVYRLIDQLVREDAATGRKAKGVLMVSSYLPELLGVCDRIAVMHRGVLGEARAVGEWDEHSLVLAATTPPPTTPPPQSKMGT